MEVVDELEDLGSDVFGADADVVHAAVRATLGGGCHRWLTSCMHDPGAVATGIFGAITVTGLSAAVAGPSVDPGREAKRLGGAVCDMLLAGIATSAPE